LRTDAADRPACRQDLCAARRLDGRQCPFLERLLHDDGNAAPADEFGEVPRRPAQRLAVTRRRLSAGPPGQEPSARGEPPARTARAPGFRPRPGAGLDARSLWPHQAWAERALGAPAGRGGSAPDPGQLAARAGRYQLRQSALGYAFTEWAALAQRADAAAGSV